MLFNENESLSEIWQTVVHELHRGALDPKHPLRFANLGTIGKHGPEVRTVVIRSIGKNLEFHCFTDYRSEKVAELTANPIGTLHFYHSQKRVQIRIKAEVEMHHQDTVAKDFWKKVPNEAKNAYTYTLAPGTPISDPKAGFDWAEKMDDQFFTVLKFIPQSIEALQLNGLRHLRILFSKKESWEGQWLVP
jgi:pyridoxine/pyridoxamine 5'-phosphate oxidase